MRKSAKECEIVLNSAKERKRIERERERERDHVSYSVQVGHRVGIAAADSYARV
jgi:hypothetical protein